MVSNPQVITFLIADNVIQEKGTNKWSVIGIFDRIYAVKFPYLHTHMALYIKFSDAEGEYNVRVEFTDSEGKKLSVFKGIKLKVNSKLDYPDFGIKTQNLIIPKPGKYHFDLYFNDNLCKSYPLIVDKKV